MVTSEVCTRFNDGNGVGSTVEGVDVAYAEGDTDGSMLGSIVGNTLGPGLGDIDMLDTATKDTLLKSTGPT